MTRLRQIAACNDSAARQFAPYSVEAEERAVKAWIALERFATMPPAELRQQFGALLEMSELIERALDAAWPEDAA